MIFGRRQRLETRAPHELHAMRRAGLVVAQALDAVRTACAPGVTTIALDEVAHDTILAAGGQPSFPHVPGYRHTLCVSVNEEIVHGIPGPRRLAAGDLVSIDCGAVVDGWHGDSAISVLVGPAAQTEPAHQRLCEVTRDALWAGIGAMSAGGHVGDIGAAVEAWVREAERRGAESTSLARYGIVAEYEGHGIGRELHMEPAVPNVRGRRGPRLAAGAVLAIEPMLTLGTPDTRELADGWTVVSEDGSWAAHWEHTVALTQTGVWVLTALDGGAAELAARGVAYGGLD